MAGLLTTLCKTELPSCAWGVSRLARLRGGYKKEIAQRLSEIIKTASTVQKTRRANKPSKNAKRKRANNKTQRGKIKALRKNMSD